MKKASDSFTKETLTNHARYYSKITVDDKEYVDIIDNLKVNNIENSNNQITIGDTCSSNITFSIYNPPISLENREIKLYEGVKVGNTINYILIGVFKVTKQNSDGENATYEAYDRMYYLMEQAYFSKLPYPSTDKAILDEICSQVGIVLATSINTPHTVSTKPEGYTRREMIGYMAALQGKNAVINNEGNLALRWYTDSNYKLDGSRYYQAGVTFTTSKNFTIDKITCAVGDRNNNISSGSGLTGLSIGNPFMTQAILDEIYHTIGGFTYRPLGVKFLGDFRLDVGDIITVTKDGKEYKVPIMEINHECDGGLISTVKAVGKSETQSSNRAAGPTTKAMERYYAELLLVNEAMVNKLDVEEAKINYATIAQLNAINGDIASLKASQISVDTLDARYASINLANIDRGSFGSILAEVGLISSATMVDGHVTGTLSSVNIDAGSITLGVLDAARIRVTNLSADSITVGQINGYQLADGIIDSDKLGDDVKNWQQLTAEDIAKALDGVDKVDTKINNMSVGVENLLNQSDKLAGSMYSGMQYAYLTDNSGVFYTNGKQRYYTRLGEVSISTIKAKNNVGETDIIPVITARASYAFDITGAFKDEGLYSFRTWFYTATATSVSVILPDGTEDELAVSGWTEYKHQGFSYKKSYKNRIRIIGNAGQMYVYHPKLERGTLCTDYSISQLDYVTIVNGKNTNYYQAFMPNGGEYCVGDNWFDTSNGYALYEWNGTAWVKAEFGAGAIRNGAIVRGKIDVAAIVEENLSDNSVSSNKIVAGAVISDKIAANSILADKIAANAVTAEKILAEAVTADKIAAQSINSGHIVAGAVTTEKLNSNAVTADKIESNSIATRHLQASSVTSSIIAANSITGQHISAYSIAADKLMIGTGGNLLANYDTFEQITDDTICRTSQGADVSISTDEAFYGNRCLYVMDDESGRKVEIELGDSSGRGLVPIRTGSMYRLTAYVKAESYADVGQAWITANFYDGDMERLSKGSTVEIDKVAKHTAGTAPKWERVECFIDKIENTDVRYLSIVINATPGYVFYVDAIQVEEVTSDKQASSLFKPSGSTIIDGGNIVTESITARQIAAQTITSAEIKAGAITADRLSVNQLSAISADIGNVTSGAISSVNYVKGVSGMKLDLNTATWDSVYFKINGEGKMISTAGNIGGWEITSKALCKDVGIYRVYTQAPTASSSWVYSCQEKKSDGNYKGNWYVRADGYMYAKKAAIGGALQGVIKIENTAERQFGIIGTFSNEDNNSKKVLSMNAEPDVALSLGFRNGTDTYKSSVEISPGGALDLYANGSPITIAGVNGHIKLDTSGVVIRPGQTSSGHPVVETTGHYIALQWNPDKWRVDVFVDETWVGYIHDPS